MSETGSGRPSSEILVQAVGAVIFASGEPVQPHEIASAFAGVAVDEVESAIDELTRQYERTAAGLRLEKVAGGVRVATRPEVGPWVRRFFRQRNRTRLSAAALETLAIVAYRQPVTAPEIQSIRGKDPSAALRGLLDKRMIRILGKKKVVGRPLLYGSSKEFLMHFGLDNLEDLPTITEFDDFAESLESASVPLSDEADGGEGPAAEAAAPTEGREDENG